MRSTHVLPHLRHDPLVCRTVIVAPQRAERPNELLGETIRCPFCAGNESLTPPDILRAPSSPATAWQARIVPNRFPVTCATTSRDDTDDEAPFARGVHDVVIESPRHVRSILDVDPEGWAASWDLCRRRLAELCDRGDLAWGTIFKNSGAGAGASLEHVHSQLVALDFVPQGFAAEIEWARRTTDPFGDCLRAAARDERIVETHDELVAVVPAAPRQPFETWIMPRVAEPFFHSTSPGRVASLAVLTRSIIGRLERLVPRADYNWWLHQFPYRAATEAAAVWHWHLEIMPRINGLAGFELGTGCHINTVAPRDAARRLRLA